MPASAAPAPTTADLALPAWQYEALAGAAQHLVDSRGTSREGMARRDLEALTAMFLEQARRAVDVRRGPDALTASEAEAAVLRVRVTGDVGHLRAFVGHMDDDAVGADEEEPSDCELGDHDMVEVDYDAPVSTQQCRTCGHTEDVDVTADIEAACAEEREQWLYGGDR